MILNQAQEKMMLARDSVNIAADTTQCTLLQQTFLQVQRMHYKIMIKSTV